MPTQETTNNNPDRLITVAIHTYDHAVMLKERLEEAGVEVTLHNVNLQAPVLASGVRVRIHERDLPLALKVIENPDSKQASRRTGTILIPIDFGDFSLKSCEVGFAYAQRMRCSVLLLHAYLNDRRTLSFFGSDNYASADDNSGTLETTAQQNMDNFMVKINEMMNEGKLPHVHIETRVSEGIPEEKILQCAQEKKVRLIVMGTCGKKNRKRQHVMGSVTAEVLDACKFPIFTIPTDCSLDQLKNISNVIFFTNLSQQDILSLDTFTRLQQQGEMNVTIIPIVEKKERKLVDQSLQQLATYCREHYPQYTFKTRRLAITRFAEEFEKFVASEHIDLVAIPNKKKGLLSRLFNPSIAHRILLQTDLPMLVVPV